MYQFLFILIVAVFAAMLFFNVFYRVKILKLYKYLVQNRIEFSTKHFFDQNKLETEVLWKYPQHKQQIQDFIMMIRRSVSYASLLIVVIILLGMLLFKFPG